MNNFSETVSESGVSFLQSTNPKVTTAMSIVVWTFATVGAVVTSKKVIGIAKAITNR